MCRAKLFLWRIIMNNMYNEERALKLGHGDGCWSICPGIPGSNKHIFFRCPKAQRGWAATTIYYEASLQSSSLVDTSSIIDIINDSLTKSPQGIARLYVIYHTCWSLWKQWNDRMYNNRRPLFAPRIIANQMTNHISVAARYYTSHKKKRRLRQAAHLIRPIHPHAAP